MNAYQILLGFVAGVCVACLFMEMRLRVRLMEQRLKDLENANQKRMNYKTMEGIENALLALDAEKREIDLHRDFVDNAIAWLVDARNPKEK